MLLTLNSVIFDVYGELCGVKEGYFLLFIDLRPLYD